jgi:hypothetical protein
VQPADRLSWTIARHAATMPEGTVFAATASAVAGIRLAQLLLGCRLYLNNRGGAFDLDGPLALHARHWMFNRRPHAHVDLAGVFDTLSEPHALFATPAQVDGSACANLSGVGPHATPKVAFGGTRGMPDAKTIHFVLPSHGVRQLVRTVDFVSTCAANREVAPMLFTELCVMRYDRMGRQWRLESLAPDQTVDAVAARTGFAFVAGSPAVLDDPPAEALRLLDAEIDPLGLRHLDFGAGRGGLMDAMARVYEREAAIVGVDKVPTHRRSRPV